MNVTKLKSLIVSKELKVQEFRELIGIPNSTFYRALRKEGELKESHIEAICNFFEVSPTELFFENIVTK